MNKERVIHSFNNQGQNRCVDIVQDEFGRYRWQEWRRDSEDQNGWFLLQDSVPLSYLSDDESIQAAVKLVTWLRADRD
jgi:hypothetical protein